MRRKYFQKDTQETDNSIYLRGGLEEEKFAYFIAECTVHIFRSLEFIITHIWVIWIMSHFKFFL